MTPDKLPQSEADGSNPVGWLTMGHYVYCFTCVPVDSQGVPIYRVNIYPYYQSCVKCAKTLVEGKTGAWPELFHPDGDISYNPYGRWKLIR